MVSNFTQLLFIFGSGEDPQGHGGGPGANSTQQIYTNFTQCLYTNFTQLFFRVGRILRGTAADRVKAPFICVGDQVVRVGNAPVEDWPLHRLIAALKGLPGEVAKRALQMSPVMLKRDLLTCSRARKVLRWL